MSAFQTEKAAGGIKAVLTGEGTVRNPDGSTRKIKLRAERELTPSEMANLNARTNPRG